MADRDKQVERAREALEEQQQRDQAEAQRRKLEGSDRPKDTPDPRPKTSEGGKRGR